tara:strand:+ start:23615 stop:24079 length:465 start_codon:yes stop_codon:yes gene_type:complete
MNHCLLEVKVKNKPTVRYTQDNKTPVAEMEVLFEGLRNDDPLGVIKVVGWGNMAQELQNRVQINQKLIVEGRLRMNTIPRQDGTKEKKAEFTLSKLHFPSQSNEENNSNQLNSSDIPVPTSDKQSNSLEENHNSNNSVTWDTSPLIPDNDEIPF